MMRSPEQQFAMAKSLPMQELIKVLQGQSDSVDMSIAEMVLRQKTQAQKAMQGAQAMKMAQAPKVFQQDIAKAQQVMQPRMEQGVAALPADVDVPEYAGGGIVAFDDGGEVQRFQGQGPSFVQQSPMARRGFTFFDLQNIGPTIKSGFESMFPPEEVEAARLRDQIRAALGGKGGPYGMFKSQTDAEFAENRALAQRLSVMPLDELRQVAEKLTAKPAAAPSAAGPTTQPAPTAPAAGSSGITQTPPSQQAPSASDQFGLASISGLARPNYSLLKSEAENIAGEFAGTTPTVPTNADATRKVLDVYAAANVDFDLFKKQAEALTKEKANIKLDRREAGSIRLIEAGLGILGGESPYAFVNIGKGASPALKGLAEDLKDIKKLDRERDKEIRNLQVAENQLRAGVGKDAFDIINRAEQRLDTFNREDRQLRASIFNNLISSETTRAVADLNARVQIGVAKATRESSREDALMRSARDLARREIDAKVRSNPTLSTDPKFDYDAEVDRREAEILQRWKLTDRVAPVETQAQGVLGPRNPDGTIDYRLVRPRS